MEAKRDLHQHQSHGTLKCTDMFRQLETVLGPVGYLKDLMEARHQHWREAQ